jgi:hypothetical protein
MSPALALRQTTTFADCPPSLALTLNVLTARDRYWFDQ